MSKQSKLVFDSASGNLQYRSGFTSIQEDDGLSEGEGEEEQSTEREDWYQSSNLLPGKSSDISSISLTPQILSEIDETVMKFKDLKKCNYDAHRLFDPKATVRAIPIRSLPHTMLADDVVGVKALIAQ